MVPLPSVSAAPCAPCFVHKVLEAHDAGKLAIQVGEIVIRVDLDQLNNVLIA